MLQKRLRFVADQSCVIQFKSIRCELAAARPATLDDAAAFSKQVLLTRRSFDLLGAFALNVNGG